jgi:hypothetical protein
LRFPALINLELSAVEVDKDNTQSQCCGGAAILAGYSKSRSFDDRSNSRPTYPTRAQTSRGLFINAHNWQTFVFYVLKSEPRYRVFVKPPILPKYHPHPIATLRQPRIRSYVFKADMYAADILRNDNDKGLSIATRFMRIGQAGSNDRNRSRMRP